VGGSSPLPTGASTVIGVALAICGVLSFCCRCNGIIQLAMASNATNTIVRHSWPLLNAGPRRSWNSVGNLPCHYRLKWARPCPLDTLVSRRYISAALIVARHRTSIHVRPLRCSLSRQRGQRGQHIYIRDNLRRDIPPWVIQNMNAPVLQQTDTLKAG